MICVRGLFLSLLLGNVNININAQSKILSLKLFMITIMTDTSKLDSLTQHC